MNVNRVTPSGYCKGVVRAIALAKKAKKDYPDKKIYIAGQIVHNHYVTDSLAALGIITLDKTYTKEEWIDRLSPGVMIFSAHGISEKIKEKAINKGFIVIDASCVDVIRTQDLVKEKLHNHYSILYIGKKGHPEAEAIQSLSEEIQLISNIKDIEHIEYDVLKKYFVTNQTTMSTFEIKNIFEAIQHKFKGAEFAEELCDATSTRQQAIISLKNCDLLYVVGDPVSNNSNKLAEIAKQVGIPMVRMIETAKEIREEDLREVENVYVTAGASTPTYLSMQVLRSLKNYAETGQLIIEEIDINKVV